MAQHKEIFKRAWQLSVLSKYKKLIWFGLIPSLFLTTLSSIVYSFRGYQYWVELVEGKAIIGVLGDIVNAILQFLGNNPGTAIFLIIIGILFAIGYFLLPVLFHGGLIKLVPYAVNDEPVKVRMGLVYGAQYFFKLFEYKALFSPFRFTWVAASYWVMRVFQPELLGVFWIPLLIWLILDIIVNFLFVFAEYFIVLKDEKVFKSIGRSVSMVFVHLEQVFNIVLLILIIELRVIINTLIIFGIPTLIILLGGLFASSLLQAIAVGLGTLVGIVLLLIICYINAIIIVFTTSAWTILFQKLDYEDQVSEQKEQMIKHSQQPQEPQRQTSQQPANIAQPQVQQNTAPTHPQMQQAPIQHQEPPYPPDQPPVEPPQTPPPTYPQQ